MVYGHYKNPCPALAYEAGRALCRLYMSDPLRYEAVLAIGEGCVSPDNPWRSPADEPAG